MEKLLKILTQAIYTLQNVLYLPELGVNLELSELLKKLRKKVRDAGCPLQPRSLHCAAEAWSSKQLFNTSDPRA